MEKNDLLFQENILFKSKKNTLANDKKNLLKINSITTIPLMSGVIIIIIMYKFSDINMNVCMVMLLLVSVMQLNTNTKLLRKYAKSYEKENEICYYLTDKYILSFDDNVVANKIELRSVSKLSKYDGNIIIETVNGDTKIIRYPEDVEKFMDRIKFEIEKNNKNIL